MDNLDEFLADREAALLSMDEETIMAYVQKYDVYLPEDKGVFWASVHMARVVLRPLPMFERAASKRWLIENGLEVSDGGEVLPPVENKTEMVKYYDRCKGFGVGGGKYEC